MVGLFVALAVGVSACALGGDAVSRQQENLANQRKAAVALVETHGGVETIRFTRQGGAPGLGAPWAVNAVITIGGVDYDEILGTAKNSVAGTPMPKIAPPESRSRVVVIYSDGSSEVLNGRG